MQTTNEGFIRIGVQLCSDRRRRLSGSALHEPLTQKRQQLCVSACSEAGWRCCSMLGAWEQPVSFLPAQWPLGQIALRMSWGVWQPPVQNCRCFASNGRWLANQSALIALHFCVRCSATSDTKLLQQQQHGLYESSVVLVTQSPTPTTNERCVREPGYLSTGTWTSTGSLTLCAFVALNCSFVESPHCGICLADAHNTFTCSWS